MAAPAPHRWSLEKVKLSALRFSITEVLKLKFFHWQQAQHRTEPL